MENAIKSVINNFVLSIFFCLLGCSENIDRNSEGITKIDIGLNIQNFKPMKLSEVASSIKYIRLQSFSGFPIGSILSFDMSGSYIVVEAKQGVDTKILLFNNKGKFLRKIGRQGSGPGEYRYPGKVYLLNDLILIPNIKNIMVYDLMGNFLEIFSGSVFSDISSRYHNWLPLSNSEILVQVANRSGDEQFRIVKTNKEGSIIRGYYNTTKFKPFYPKRSGGTDTRSGYFYQFEDRIRYKEIVNDTIWEVLPDTLIPVYIMNRGKFGLDVDYRTLPREQRHKDIRINTVLEIDDYIFFEMATMEHYPFRFYKGIMGNGAKWPYPILGVFNKKKGETFFVEPSNVFGEEFPLGFPTGLENDIDGGINFFPCYKASDSVLVSWIDAYKLKEFAASKAFQMTVPIYSKKKNDFERLASSLSIDDNPVLMVVKLK